MRSGLGPQHSSIKERLGPRKINVQEDLEPSSKMPRSSQTLPSRRRKSKEDGTPRKKWKKKEGSGTAHKMNKVSLKKIEKSLLFPLPRKSGYQTPHPSLLR